MSWENILKEPSKGRHILGRGTKGLMYKIYSMLEYDITNAPQKEELHSELRKIENSWPKIKETINRLRKKMKNEDGNTPVDYFSEPPIAIPKILFGDEGTKIPARFFTRLDEIERYLNPVRKIGNRQTDIIKFLLDAKRYKDLNAYVTGEVSYNRLKFVNEGKLIRDSKEQVGASGVKQRKTKLKQQLLPIRKEVEEALKNKPELLGYNIEGTTFVFDNTLKDKLFSNLEGDDETKLASFENWVKKGLGKSADVIEDGRFWKVVGKGFVNREQLAYIAGAKIQGEPVRKTVFANVLGYPNYAQFEERTITAKRQDILRRTRKLKVERRPEDTIIGYYRKVVASNGAKKSDYDKFLYGSGNKVLSTNSKDIEERNVIDFYLKNTNKDMAKKEIESRNMVEGKVSSGKEEILLEKMKNILLGNDAEYSTLKDISGIDREVAEGVEDSFNEGNKNFTDWANSVMVTTGESSDDDIILQKQIRTILSALEKTSSSLGAEKQMEYVKLLDDELGIKDISSKELTKLKEAISLMLDEPEDKQEMKNQKKEIPNELGKIIPSLRGQSYRRIKNMLITGTIDHPDGIKVRDSEGKETDKIKQITQYTPLGTAITNINLETKSEKIEENKTNIGSLLLNIIEIGYQFDYTVNNDSALMDEFLEYEEKEDDNKVTMSLVETTLDTFYDRYDKIRDAVLSEIDKSIVYVLENNIIRNKVSGVRILEWLYDEVGIQEMLEKKN